MRYLKNIESLGGSEFNEFAPILVFQIYDQFEQIVFVFKQFFQVEKQINNEYVEYYPIEIWLLDKLDQKIRNYNCVEEIKVRLNDEWMFLLPLFCEEL